MNSLRSDIRYALRTLGRAPGFTAVALATLCLGVGANTAIFSVVRGVLIRPLPFPDPGRLVMLRELRPRTGAIDLNVSPNNFVFIRTSARSFHPLGAFDLASFNLTGLGEAERLRGAFVTPELFSVLGVSPALGRPFAAGDEKRTAGRVVLLSHDLWKRRFGSSRSLVGSSILLDGEPHTIIEP